MLVFPKFIIRIPAATAPPTGENDTRYGAKASPVIASQHFSFKAIVFSDIGRARSHAEATLIDAHNFDAL